jgi:RNA polymerase sigma-70 factor (ECF subfamily)
MTAAPSFRDDLLSNLNDAFGVACRIVQDRDRARDVTQEAVCRALRYENGFDAGRPVRPWFLTIVRNVAIDDVRRPQHAHDLPEIAHDDAVLDRLIEREECASVLREMALLRPAYRRALELKCRGLAYRDIAQQLGIPVGTAQTFVHRAKLALRAKFAVRDDRAGGGYLSMPTRVSM